MSDLTIKVDGEISTKLDKLSGALESGQKGGAIKPEQYRKAADQVDALRKMLEKGNFTENDIKNFKKGFQDVAKVLDNAANKFVELTKEAAEKQKKVQQLQDKLNEQTAKKNASREKRAEAQTGYTKTIIENGIRVGKGKGITNIQTALKNSVYDAGTQRYKLKSDVPIYDDKGHELVGKERRKLVKAINDQLTAYAKATAEMQKADSDIKKGKEDLAKAEKDLAKKIDEDKAAGKGKNVEFGSQVSEATGGMHDAISSMEAGMAQGKETEAIANAELDLSGLNQDLTKTTSSLGKVVKQFSLFAIGIRLAKKAISEVRKTITELDKSLTEQAMVTGKTRKEVYGLLSTYQDLAIKTGSTTKEVAATMTEYIRQGKSVQDSLILTEAAIDAAKVASINAADSINYLTTALNGFQLSAKQAMEVSDKFAAVSANAATSYEEIAIALSKVASQANLAGMSIDYTTALLAKGLETTREAPETIGTALKTVIARMREIEDFGQTLEDGTDLNNVETQLAYIGIALRNTNGELRSTEDVLNDLGQKWDTLNSNQQAAVAKALAGTRQQSRLIAMMSDYERVIELQEISARSSGATLAQMKTYTEGLEASLNRLSTSWEKIVSTVSDSDVIIFLIDTLTGALDVVNSIVSNTFGMIAVLTIIAAVGAKILANKIQERNLNQMILRSQLKDREATLKKLKNQQTLLKQKVLEVKLASKQAELTEIEAKLKNAQTDAERTQLSEQRLKCVAEIAETEAQIKVVNSDIATIDSEINKNLAEQGKASGGILNTITQMVPGATAILSIINLITAATVKLGAIRKKQHAEKIKDDAAEGAAQVPNVAGSGWKAGIPGLIASFAAAAVIAAMIGVAFANSMGAFKSESERTDTKLNELNASIYNMTKTKQAVLSVVNNIDDLDKKIIKTKKDTEELAESLASVGDKLSTDESKNIISGLGMSEKEYYDMLSDSDKESFLKTYLDALDEKLADAREQQRELLKNGIRSETQRLTAKTVVKQDVYNTLESERYSSLTSEQTRDLRVITENIINEFDKDNLADFTQDMSKIQRIMDKIASSEQYTILEDESATLKERVKAYEALARAFKDNAVALKSFNEAYKDFAELQALGDSFLNAIDNLNINVEKLNDLSTTYDTVKKELGKSFSLTVDEYKDKIEDFILTLSSNGGDFADAVKVTFDEVLSSADSYGDALNTIVSQLGNVLQVGILNIGQSADKLKNSITGVYETADKWATMSTLERTQYMSEHGDLFKGESGAVLLKALETQDYGQIQAALRENDTLSKNLNAQIKQVEQELAIERARTGEERNEALIKTLEEHLKELQSEDFFRASLNAIIEQENSRLEEFKKLLQEEEDALTDSLNKRKQIYQEYFSAINQSAEDEEYEEKATQIVTNISKLAGSGSMSSKSQIEELENSLMELEKERVKTLRERAQEAVINSIDDTISLIEEDFEKLLSTNQQILDTLRGTSDVELVAKTLSSNDFISKTANEAQQYLNDMQSIYGSQLSGIDWSAISVTDNGNTLNLNINGQTIEVSKENQQNIFEAVMAALTQNGVNGGSAR